MGRVVLTRLILHAVPLLWFGIAHSADLPTGPASDYAKQVKPVLAKRCFSCHGALKQESSLRLDTGKLIRQGGEGGPAVTPGKAETSLLVQRITTKDDSSRMPPEGEPLTASEVQAIKVWIAGGAKTPADEKPLPDPRQHWAFRKPTRPPPPKISDAAVARLRNPIDRFLEARRQAAGVRSLPQADRHTLLRRVYLDLIGVPPTREEQQAFVNDRSPDAYERVVERLLNDPQHGERWARHWMDVWRYSDWYGRRSVPDVMNSYPQIWRWRDWIVASLNADRPYDRMVQEMLAGDELAPGDDATVVATGFLVRNWFKWNYEQWMKDNVEHTGKAFLGLTMNCAHCHDHKYDPIRQEEYFRFRAFFEPLELRQDRVPGLPDPGPFEKYVYTKSYGPIAAGLIRVFDEKLDAPTYMYHGGDPRNRMKGRPPVKAAGLALLAGDKLDISPVTLPAAAYYPGLRPAIRDEERTKLRAAIAAAQTPPAKAEAEAKLKSLEARIAADDAKFYGVGHVAELARAAHRAEKEVSLVTARNLFAVAEAKQSSNKNPAEGAKLKQQFDAAQTAMKNAEAAVAKDGDTYAPLSPVYPPRSTGRRLALARWITSAENPLPARVAANHIWSWHFGRPLVETTNNFGTSGREPSHPQLLDWLAVELMERGWQMKHLHRMIVTSAAYRAQSSIGDAAADVAEVARIRGDVRAPNSGEFGDWQDNAARDRDNLLLWRFPTGRMEAEVVRDAILHVSRDVDAQIGGHEIDHALGLKVHRKSLYFSIHGEAKMQFLDLFDGPNVCDCYRRTTSVLPQQALAMSNSELLLHQSRTLAGRLWAVVQSGDSAVRTATSQESFVRAAFEQLLARPATPREEQLSLEFLARQTALFESVKPADLNASPPGIVAPSADPAQRARENLIQALFNHNDFVTVR